MQVGDNPGRLRSVVTRSKSKFPSPSAGPTKRSHTTHIQHPAPYIRFKEQSKRVEAQVEAQLKENFKKEYAEEAEAKEDFIQKEKEIVKEIVKQPETTSANVGVDLDKANKKTLNLIVESVIKENKNEKIRAAKQPRNAMHDRRVQNATRVAEGISAQIQGLSSIPVFQDYSPDQIKDFVLKIFPDDAISVLDNFEKLSSTSQKEIVDFVILKCKAVTLNVSVDDAGVPDHVYNTLGIKSLPLLDVDGMPSSDRALMVCKPEPCPVAGVAGVAGAAGAARIAEWCCCIRSNDDFSDIADTILGQDSPFVTAHPDIQRMIGSCRSLAIAPGGDDPQGFGDPFPSVIIGSDAIVYSIGPIIDAESILGRPLIMIRIHNYKNEDYPNGIYFWVYPSFSEGGASRVFLIIGGRQFMKGPDYTLTTFIIDLLQVHINKYYAEHFVLKQGPGFSPTILSTQQEVICFFGGMIHLQTRWVHDLIAGRGLNMEAVPTGPVPPGFNRHCYTFDSSLPIKRWIVSGIDDVASPPSVVGLSPQEAHLAQQFLTDNRTFTGQRLASSFPLSCCLTTIFHKYRGPGTDVNDFFALFKRWPDTLFVQGCNVVPGVSPVGYVVAGTSSNLQGMRYNIFLEHLAPLEFVKRFKSLRLVQPIVTPDPGETFAMIGRMGRSGLLIKKRTPLGIETAELETCLMVVNLAPAAVEIYTMETTESRILNNSEKTEIIFSNLPRQLKTTIKNIIKVFFAFGPTQILKIKECFINFLQLPPDFISRNPNRNDLLMRIIIPSVKFLTSSAGEPTIAIVKDSPLYRLIRTLETGEYRHLLMSSMLDEYTGMVSFPLVIPRI